MNETMTAAEYRQAQYATMLERELQEQVRQLAKVHGWLYYHTHSSRHSPAGFPDCVLMRSAEYRGGWSPLIVAELKREDEDPTQAQMEWLEAFQATFGQLVDDDNVIVECWRPSDIPRIEALLSGDRNWREAES